MILLGFKQKPQRLASVFRVELTAEEILVLMDALALHLEHRNEFSGSENSLCDKMAPEFISMWTNYLTERRAWFAERR